MLEVLKEKGLYKGIFCQYFAGGTEFAVEDGHYDAVVINGAFVKGHLPVDALREIARILKSGTRIS